MIRPTVEFKGVDYFIDMEMNELRAVKDYTDIVPLGSLQDLELEALRDACLLREQEFTDFISIIDQYEDELVDIPPHAQTIEEPLPSSSNGWDHQST